MVVGVVLVLKKRLTKNKQVQKNIKYPELLEGNQVLLGQISASKVVEVDRVTGRIALSPSVSLQRRLPIAVIRRVDGSPSLVVAGSGLGSKTDATDSAFIPLIEEILSAGVSPRTIKKYKRNLLSGGSKSGVQSDVIVLRLGSAL